MGRSGRTRPPPKTVTRIIERLLNRGDTIRVSEGIRSSVIAGSTNHRAPPASRMKTQILLETARILRGSVEAASRFVNPRSGDISSPDIHPELFDRAGRQHSALWLEHGGMTRRRRRKERTSIQLQGDGTNIGTFTPFALDKAWARALLEEDYNKGLYRSKSYAE